MTELKGKVAMVSGGSRGIGRAVVKRLAEDGAMVRVNDWGERWSGGRFRLGDRDLPKRRQWSRVRQQILACASHAFGVVSAWPLTAEIGNGKCGILSKSVPPRALEHHGVMGVFGMTAIFASEPFISTPKDSPAYWLLDILWVVHASGEQTQGSYSLVEQWMPEGVGPPPHVHPYEDESFWVIEGEMTVEVGGKMLILGPGSLGHVPRNTVHSFKVTSKAVCHILNYYTPAGFEQCIIGSARPAGRRELPPRGLDPLDSPQVARFFNNYSVAPADLPWALQKFDRRV